jgi:DME family drug/metabolite transporter
MTAEFSLGSLLMAPALIVAGVDWLTRPAGLAVALWLGLGTTAAACILFGRSLRVLEAGPVATLVLAEPLVVTLLGVVVLGERLAPVAVAGAALITAGLAIQGLSSTRAARHEHADLAGAPPS